MKKILITGSLGLVGSACMELFTAEGWDVIGVDNNMRSHFFGTPKKYTSKSIDIRDSNAMQDLFIQKAPFDAIIHAAAQPSHDYSTDHVLEDFDINVRATVHLLELTRITSPNAAFVFVSTDKVYGENMSVVLKEGETRYQGVSLEGYKLAGFDEEIGLDFAGHRSPFGCSKAAADMYAQEYAVTFGLKTGIFRPGCITGKNHEGAELHGFLAYLAKCIKNGTIYKIFGNGKNVRDQIHAYDLASAFSAFVDRPQSGAVYNIGGGPERSVSVLEASELLSKAIGKPFLYEFAEARKGDRLWDVHDVSKFRKDYPEWDYKYSLSDIIEDLCEKV